MRVTMRSFFTVAAAVFVATAGSLAVQAASISYGNVGPVPPGVTFLNVTESSGTDPVPLYGAPSPFPVGLTFSPSPSFAASSAGGGADLTDGQLNFSIMSPGVTSVSLSEGGEFALTGIGTPATQVLASASLRVTVTELNGVNVAPITLPLSNASVGFNLIANPGTMQPWSLGTTVNVAGLLTSLGFGGQNATKVDVVIDNQLGAVSELASAASITKTRFGITTEVVPEPSTLAMAGLGLCGLGAVAARRRRLPR